MESRIKQIKESIFTIKKKKIIFQAKDETYLTRLGLQEKKYFTTDSEEKKNAFFIFQDKP